MEDMVYEAQRKVILELADKESCVIIGRNADFILKDRDDVLNVFIHGDMPEEIQRISRLYHVNEQEAVKLMAEPDKYIGKTLCIDGLYYTGQNEKTGTYYHYSIIKDALACCSQGLEFVWGDGSHVYPDEYPKDETEIEVKGTFETYKEPGDDTLYCHLVDSELQVK